jgi:hypothetical protein
MHRRDVRVAQVRDHRDARCPESGIIGRARNLSAKFRREFAVNGRAMHADFLEQPPVHHPHDPAAARLAGMVGAIPRCPFKSPGRVGIKRSRGLVFQPFEGGADVIAQGFEPGLRASLAIFEEGSIHWRCLISNPLQIF